MNARTGVAVVGLVLGGMAALACGSDDQLEPAEYQEQCVKYVNDELVRVADEECDRSGSGSFWFYSRGYTPGAVGSKVNPASGTTIKPPAGAGIARPPASGGFGLGKGAGT